MGMLDQASRRENGAAIFQARRVVEARSCGRGVLKNRQGFSTNMGPPYPGRALKNLGGFSTERQRKEWAAVSG